MALKGGSKIDCFQLWQAGASVAQIEQQVTATPKSVRDWIREWGEG